MKITVIVLLVSEKTVQAGWQHSEKERGRWGNRQLEHKAAQEELAGSPSHWSYSKQMSRKHEEGPWPEGSQVIHWSGEVSEGIYWTGVVQPGLENGGGQRTPNGEEGDVMWDVGGISYHKLMNSTALHLDLQQIMKYKV